MCSTIKTVSRELTAQQLSSFNLNGILLEKQKFETTLHTKSNLHLNKVINSVF